MASAAAIDDTQLNIFDGITSHNGEEANIIYTRSAYDHTLCQNGNPSPIISDRRSDCVNEKPEFRSFDVFDEYTNIRDIRNNYLKKAAEDIDKDENAQ